MRRADNLIVHELIGLRVRVVRASAPEYQGLEGDVVDETMNVLVVNTGKGPKTVPKKGTIFEFELPTGEKVLVDGNLIRHRPEERTKKLWRIVLRMRGRVRKRA